MSGVAATETSNTPSGDPPQLKQAIGPGLLLLFIVGDILGTGVYALTGRVAAEVGGAGWVAVIIAFGVAMLTAFSYLELVTKYPQAAGAALYVHKAFGIHFLTFMVTFAVLLSGITSASTSAITLAENFVVGMGFAWSGLQVTLVALAFIAVVMAVNLRGVSESMRTNVVLVCIELTGLLIIIGIGVAAVFGGNADFSNALIFESPGDRSVFLAVSGATALAFFSMVGFEDSVNMAEETKDASRTFPKVLISGLSITGVIYVLVSITAVALVPIGTLAESTTPLLEVVRLGAPGLPIDDIFPFLTMFAVANTSLINMMMASRLLYGMARQDVLPRSLGKVLRTRRTPWSSILFTTALAAGLILVVRNALGDDTIGALGGTTSLLLLGVFAIVNIAVLVLRRDPVGHDHFRTPSALPIVGAVTAAFLVGPWAQDPINYRIAGVLLAIGVVLALFTYLMNAGVRAKRTRFRDVDELDAERRDDLGGR